MRVRIKLFATLARLASDAVPGVPFTVELPDGAAIADLVHRLELPSEEVKVVFVNGRARPMDWPLGPGDEVGLFPLIGGG
jgi:molybdopterin synthase sulfur carrier subunit